MTTIATRQFVRSARLAGLAAHSAGMLIAAALLFSAPVILTFGGAGIAQAQGSDKEKEENGKAPRSGRQTQALSKRVYEAITEANEKVDQEDYAGALKILDKVKAMPNLSEYETAQVYSFYGFLYFNAEDYQKAMDAYNTVLQQPELPEALQQQTIRTLSQLAFVLEDYDLAVKYANQYMSDVGPDPDMYVVIATAYYQKASDKDDRDQATAADWKRVIEPIDEAIALANERGTSVKEQWLLLKRVAYWNLDDYKQVKNILEQLVVGWPKKEYWTQLSGIYFELSDEPRQLAAYQAAYDQALLTKSAELVQMAQLFMQAEVPYKGAKVLEQGLEADAVERNVRNLRLLSQAWQLAQEDRKAIPPLKEAAGMTDDGDLYARLAQSYLNLSEYKSCIDASNSAISKGGLKTPGNAYLILGMCQFETKSLKSAKASFRKALKYEKAVKNATSWISYVESEEARLRQLEESLQRVREIRQEAQS